MMPNPEGYVNRNVARSRNRRSAIIDTLQCRKFIKAHELAANFNTTIRTIYRDVARLKREGHQIDGEAGVGYMMRGRRQ